MGAQVSLDLVGCPELVSFALQWTSFDEIHIDAIGTRFERLRRPLALSEETIAVLLESERECGNEKEVLLAFDLEERGIIPSCQLLAALILVSSLKESEKVERLFDAFDFGRAQSLSVDEMAILLRNTFLAAKSVDRNLQESDISIQKSQSLAKSLFLESHLQKTLDEEISKAEFLQLCMEQQSDFHNFVRYFSSTGAVSFQHLETGTTWKDDFFDQHDIPETKDLEWKSAPSDAVLFLPEGEIASRICPGLRKDFAFCSALNMLGLRPKLIAALFMKTGQENQGHFAIRLFHQGKYQQVHVDERLLRSRSLECPSCRRIFPGGFYALTHAADGPANGIWMMLIEKAAAKLVGSFKSLEKLCIKDALEMLTGAGSVETGSIPSDVNDAFQVLELAQ